VTVIRIVTLPGHSRRMQPSHTRPDHALSVVVIDSQCRLSDTRQTIEVFVDPCPIPLKNSANTQWHIDLRNIVVPAHLLAAVCCNEGFYCESLFHPKSGRRVFQHNRPTADLHDRIKLRRNVTITARCRGDTRECPDCGRSSERACIVERNCLMLVDGRQLETPYETVEYPWSFDQNADLAVGR
jgi:hypothetical protein